MFCSVFPSCSDPNTIIWHNVSTKVLWDEETESRVIVAKNHPMAGGTYFLSCTKSGTEDALTPEFSTF